MGGQGDGKMKKKHIGKRKPTKKSKPSQENNGFRLVPIEDHFDKDDLRERITDCIFKIINGQPLEVKKIRIVPGDLIRNEDNCLYPIHETQRPAVLTPTTPIIVKSNSIYGLIPYSFYGREKPLTLKKGISAQDFIQRLTNEVIRFLEIKQSGSLYQYYSNIEYVSKQLHGKTISRDDRKKRRVFNELSSPSNLIEHKKQMVYNLISILQNSIDGMNSERMTIHYLGKILSVSGIEKGNLEDVERNLQFKYRGLIKS